MAGGKSLSLKEIVENKKLYDGKSITKEKNTASTKDIYKIVVKGENVYVSGKRRTYT